MLSVPVVFMRRRQLDENRSALARRMSGRRSERGRVWIDVHTLCIIQWKLAL